MMMSGELEDSSHFWQLIQNWERPNFFESLKQSFTFVMVVKILTTSARMRGVFSNDFGRSFIERGDMYGPRKGPCGTSENKMNFENRDDANVHRWRRFNMYLSQQKYSEVLSNPFLWHNFPDEQCVIWAFSFSRLVVNAFLYVKVSLDKEHLIGHS